MPKQPKKKVVKKSAAPKKAARVAPSLPAPAKRKVEIIAPQAGPQTLFCSSPADIVFYGGAAGGGKTVGLLLEAARHIRKPGFKAVIFRRTYPEIRNPGGLWDTAGMFYPLIKGVAKEGQNAYVWSNGSLVQFAHMQHEKDKYAWMGSALPLIMFDEVTHFSKSMFFYMLSRNRLASNLGMRPYLRATCNPDANSWVADFISWWIDPATGLAITERAGVVRWFVRDEDKIVWRDNKEDFNDELRDQAKSVTFIPSKVTDNQILMRNNPDYLNNLKALSLVEKEQLLKGNWKVRAVSGMVFRRDWFEVVDDVPSGGREVRYWDRASTEQGPGASDPDWTAGCKMRRVGDTLYVLDMCRFRGNPGTVKKTMKNVASQDGKRCDIWAEQDPGQAGVSEIVDLAAEFGAYSFYANKVTEAKYIRAKPASAAALNGRIKVLRAPWNEDFFTELENFADEDQIDDGVTLGKDDQVDAFSGAYNVLSADNGPSIR